MRRVLDYATYQLVVFGLAGVALFALVSLRGAGPAVSREVFETALALDPHYAAGHRVLGEELVREGRLIDGLEHLRRAREDDPQDSTVCLSLGRAAWKAEARTEARTAFECAAAAAPGNVSAWADLGGVSLELQDLARATSATERALELDPQRNDLRLNLGTALARAGELDRAQKIFFEAARRSPDDANVAFNLGLTLKKRGDAAQATQWLTRASQLDPNLARAWFHLAVLAQQRNDLTVARDAARRAVELEPSAENRALAQQLGVQ